MKRRVGVVAVVLAAVVAVFLWRHHGESSSSETTAGGSTASGFAGAQSTALAVRKDPRTLARASISGAITDAEAKQPIAGARVCASASSRDVPQDLVRESICTQSDAAGRYKLENLLAAHYTVGAMAKTYRPASYHPSGDRKKTDFELKAGEQKTADIALAPGGVEVTGTVSDISGGVVAKAQVRAGAGWWGGEGEGVSVDTDDKGRYSLWVKPGSTVVSAAADGYAPGRASGEAPGTVDVFLTPESTLAGTVVDGATNKPIEGAHVNIGRSEYWSGDGHDAYDITDAEGRFKASRLAPGRYTASVHMPHGYGRTEGSTLVGLGQHVDGLLVKVWPARRVEGMVVKAGEKTPCADSTLYFSNAADGDWFSATRADDGTLYADGVLPGTYTPQPGCPDTSARDKYDAVTVADKDVTGLVWEMDAGGAIRGRVLGKTNTPVESAQVSARSVGGAARDKTSRDWDQSIADGHYELTGLKAGSYKLDVSSDKGVAPRDGYAATVVAGKTVEQDLVLEDAGTVKGTVVDGAGKPVPGVDIEARSAEQGNWFFGGFDKKSDDAGAFELTGVRPGEYRIIARRGWMDELRKPGTTDDAKQGEKTTVKAGETSVVRIVVEAQTGVIKGTVVDSSGKPVTDAFISVARESDAAGSRRSGVEQTHWGEWSTENKPVLTSTEGAFTVTKLAPGSYAVRAYRKGGGEAVNEHVAVGSSTTLQIKPTGSLDGNVTRAGGSAPDMITVGVQDLKAGFSRSERFYKTGGHFVLHDLPAGHFKVSAEAEGARASIDLDLAEGEQKTGVALPLETLVTLTGRVVELGAGTPVPAMSVFARPATGGSFTFSMDGSTDNVTDDAGRFTVKNAPTGSVAVQVMPKDWSDDSPFGFAYVPKTVTGTGTVDVGDVPIVRKRVKKGETVGDLGIHWVEQGNDTTPDQFKYEVSFLDPTGPAAKTELKVGDLVISVDGQDVSGANAPLGWTLLQVTPGTKVTLGTKRGPTVTVTAASP